MQRLVNYFTSSIVSKTLQTIGMEIETQFVDRQGRAIQTETSQQMLGFLTKVGWRVENRKGGLITTLADEDGNKIFYELGRHNMEVSTVASTSNLVLTTGQKCLNQLYCTARVFGAEPYFEPILRSKEDLLVVPDERDAVWIQLDGRSALAPLACTSSVQFTISVDPKDAITILNKLGESLGTFMMDYPQEVVWKKYVKESSAGYRSDRYGGPVFFESLQCYCSALAQHDVVQGARLVPFSEVSNLDIPLFLRSVWWYFRLKRYGNALCIEVRPMARRGDEQFQLQLEKVLQVFDK